MTLTKAELGIFKLSATELLDKLHKTLQQHGYKKIIKHQDFVYATGKLPVMLVAHVDTVHRLLPEKVYYDRVENVAWSPDGLGADDRAGVIGILRLLERGYMPHVLFTDKEESGGIGATAFIKQVNDFGVRFIIELDRKNGTEAAFYGCDNPDFLKYITGFGFKEVSGSFTDISIICPKWGVAGVNLSCGYHNAHCDTEYLSVNELESTIDKVGKIFNAIPSKRFKYSYNKVKTYGFTKNSRGYDLYGAYGAYGTGTYKSNSWYSSYDSYKDDGYDLVPTTKVSASTAVVIKTEVYPDILVFDFGGQAEMWAQWLRANQTLLESAAENAIWDTIERKMLLADVAKEGTL